MKKCNGSKEVLSMLEDEPKGIMFDPNDPSNETVLLGE